MIKTNYNSSFPDQVVPDVEKASYDYGLQVGRAVESEWFKSDRGWQDRFDTNYNNFHRLRLYARGEQSIQKYKDELSINGDLSYLNLDWKPVPVIPKFVDIVVNGIPLIGAIDFGSSATLLLNLVPNPPANMITSCSMNYFSFSNNVSSTNSQMMCPTRI